MIENLIFIFDFERAYTTTEKLEKDETIGKIIQVIFGYFEAEIIKLLEFQICF